MSTYVFAPWTIGPDRSDEDTTSPLRRIECTTCGEKSENGVEQVGPDMWAISHAVRTSHRGFREVVTALLRVVPAPGNPYHGKEDSDDLWEV
ncbi:hypothetical protein ACFY12_07575 [Streptomyces sp. NPDC001339]|uniref:DUF7848 domain-containing protein n=1 Tax=Streptomyces sp. NPDC001339 TaxID=3364563 RepID=UPI0036B63DBD